MTRGQNMLMGQGKERKKVIDKGKAKSGGSELESKFVEKYIMAKNVDK